MMPAPALPLSSASTPPPPPSPPRPALPSYVPTARATPPTLSLVQVGRDDHILHTHTLIPPPLPAQHCHLSYPTAQATPPTLSLVQVGRDDHILPEHEQHKGQHHSEQELQEPCVTEPSHARLQLLRTGVTYPVADAVQGCSENPRRHQKQKKVPGNCFELQSTPDSCWLP